MSALRTAGYEVTADLVELVTPTGHKQWLGRGAELPDWVPDDKVTALVSSGALTVYEVI